jgi:hypothetical protein
MEAAHGIDVLDAEDEADLCADGGGNVFIEFADTPAGCA